MEHCGPTDELGYHFPIDIEEIYTSSGQLVPGKRALIKKDTNKILTLISDRYLYKPFHKTVDEVKNLFAGLGISDTSVYVSSSNLNLAITGDFRCLAREAFTDVKLNMFLVARRNYKTRCPSPDLYMGCTIDKGKGGWLLHEDPITKYHTEMGTCYAENKIIKEWERSSDIWSSLSQFAYPYERMEKALGMGIDSVIPRSDGRALVRGLKINAEDQVSVFEVYQAVAKYIADEKCTTFETKIKKQRLLSKFINIKFHLPREV